jgi:16S rRNA (adenine1518-N6/adenine1519-N6)-dimethyltransferase
MISPQRALRILGREPVKGLGQHFLINEASAEAIAAAICPEPGDLVLEIGAGLGALTLPLSRSGARVVAVEVDAGLAAFLRKELEEHGSGEQVRIECMDALEFDVAELHRDGQRKLKVIGNLPYNISTPVLFKLMDQAHCIEKAVLMLQGEVADRVLAGPGSRDYGILSVMAAFHSERSRVKRLKPSQFYPPPKVDSTVVALAFRPCPLRPRVTADALRRVVKAAFAHRRKTVRNSLLASTTLEISAEALDAALEEAAIEPGVRPERLDLEAFLRLTHALEDAVV